MNSPGTQQIQGILSDVTFESPDETLEVGEDTKIDLITLVIDNRPVFVYPFRELLVVKNIPPFLSDFAEPYEITMVVRKYGVYLFAFDYDLYNAVFRKLKELKSNGKK